MIDGRMMMVSFPTLTIGNNQGMGDIEYAKMLDFYVPRRVDPVERARDRYEFARAFGSFPQDADKLFSGWRGCLLNRWFPPLTGGRTFSCFAV